VLAVVYTVGYVLFVMLSVINAVCCVYYINLPSVLMLSVFISLLMLCIFMLSVIYAEYCCAGCSLCLVLVMFYCYAECHLCRMLLYQVCFCYVSLG
jgi:hypothetical protein